MALADRANQYVDAQKPWALAKDPAKAAAEVVAVCTQGINLFRVLMSYLAPVLPALAERAEKLPRGRRAALERRHGAAARPQNRALRAAAPAHRARDTREDRRGDTCTNRRYDDHHASK